ncbi:MAG: methyltransferase domain-containing protein [Coriobacteriia bacterium]|nr:methyltransferase domain-containing protein [Coriobacteriia bacterium]
MKWSVHGQTPLYLAMSRMATLNPAVMDQIMTRLPLEPGMRVLDVGCGSGEFTFRLAERVQGVSFTGVDYDQGFVDCCTARAAGQDTTPLTPAPAGNDYAFLQADGMALPFADASFDLVAGHTYLTALPDYYGALQEMMRVCKPGGLVASVTSMGDAYDRFGRMDLLPPVLPAADAAVVDRVRGCIRRTDGGMDMRSGVPSGKVQLTFSRCGLEQVTTLPLAQYLSLSDAALPADQYHRFVDLLYAVEVESAEAARQVSRGEADAPSDRDWDDYHNVLTLRRDQLHGLQGRNQEWAWHGSAAILVTGRMPQDAPRASGLARCLQAEPWAPREAAALASFAQNADPAPEQTTVQTGCGRACAVKLEAGTDQPVVWGAGFTPQQAAAHAYAQLADAGSRSEPGSLGSGTTPTLAQVEAASAALEQFVAQHLADGPTVLPPAHDSQVYGVPGVYETAYDAISQGYAVQFFDASLGLGVPAMACRLTGKGRESWGLASYPSLSVVAQRACARALACLAGAPATTLPVNADPAATPDWEAPLWAEAPADPEGALDLLHQTFSYLGWDAEFEDVTSPAGTDLSLVRCVLRP